MSLIIVNFDFSMAEHSLGWLTAYECSQSWFVNACGIEK